MISTDSNVCIWCMKFIDLSGASGPTVSCSEGHSYCKKCATELFISIHNCAACNLLPPNLQTKIIIPIPLNPTSETDSPIEQTAQAISHLHLAPLDDSSKMPSPEPKLSTEESKVLIAQGAHKAIYRYPNGQVVAESILADSLNWGVDSDDDLPPSTISRYWVNPDSLPSTDMLPPEAKEWSPRKDHPK